MTAVVVGAGVVGLSAAIRLQEAGWKVTIIARDTTPGTTSDGSAAIWFPFLSQPLDKVLAWSKEAFHMFVDLCKDPSSGIEMFPGFELYREPHPNPPSWAHVVPDARPATKEELSSLAPCFVDAYFATVPVATMPVYLRYLMIRFHKNGGKFVAGTITEFESLRSQPGVALVVNCTGMEAGALLNDKECYPTRGQIMRVHAPGVRHFYFDDANPAGITYIIPRSDLVVLGGTGQKGDFDTKVHEETAAGILKRTSLIRPELAQAPLISHWTGLRPSRSAVRVELDADSASKTKQGKAPLVHNYGHGGSGMTIAWGTAATVVKLAEPFFEKTVQVVEKK